MKLELQKYKSLSSLVPINMNKNSDVEYFGLGKFFNKSKKRIK